MKVLSPFYLTLLGRTLCIQNSILKFDCSDLSNNYLGCGCSRSQLGNCDVEQNNCVNVSLIPEEIHEKYEFLKDLNTSTNIASVGIDLGLNEWPEWAGNVGCTNDPFLQCEGRYISNMLVFYVVYSYLDNF